jgi:hypothetical protein
MQTAHATNDQCQHSEMTNNISPLGRGAGVCLCAMQTALATNDQCQRSEMTNNISHLERGAGVCLCAMQTALPPMTNASAAK